MTSRATACASPRRQAGGRRPRRTARRAPRRARPARRGDRAAGDVDVVADRRRDDRADRRDRDQPGDARDRVVDRRGDAGVRLVGVGEHRRGERGDRHRQPDREQDQRRQQLGHVVGARVRRAAAAHAAGGDQRADRQEQVRAVAVGQRAEAARQQEHHERRRQRRRSPPPAPSSRRPAAGTRSGRRTACSSPAYIANVSAFATAKLRRRNRSSGSIGCGVRSSWTMNAPNSATPPSSGRRRRGLAPAVQRLLDQPEREARQAQRAQHRADDVEPHAAARAALRHGARRRATSVAITSGTLIAKIQRQDAESTSCPPISGPATIPMPPHAVQRPTARPRSSGGNVARSPRARPASAARRTTPCSARAPTSNLDRRRQRAQHRRDAEAGDAEREDALLAEQVPERARHEDQRARASAGRRWRSTAARRARRRGPRGSPAEPR